MRPDVAAWRAQADADLKTAGDAASAGNHYAAAFFAQQAAEKALKAVHLHEVRRPYIGHGLVHVARAVKAPAAIVDAASALTPHYIQTRYPDAAVGTPAENYTADVARRAIRDATEVIAWTRQRLPK